MKGFRKLLNQVRLAWISLISKIKNFFSSNKHTSLENDHTKTTSIENRKGNEIDSEDEEVFYDALDEEEYFDAVENLNEQENSEEGEYKYYSLQDGLQEKIEFDRATYTLALAFEIERPLRDLSKFKLCELKQNGDKYTFTLEDNGKNRIELHSQYLNIYFPKYFEKHSKKGMYTELFSEKENGVSNDIIIPLQVPEGVSILIEKLSWTDPRKIIQSKIPDFPMDMYLRNCKDHVNFYLNSHNTISLSMTSTKAQSAAILSGTPTETHWLVKDILVSGKFANTVYEQPEVVEPFEVVDMENLERNKVLC